MKLIQKLREIWSIEELRQRILLTLGLIVIYRLGTYITFPVLTLLRLILSNHKGQVVSWVW